MAALEKRLSVSEARARFSELVDYVTSTPDSHVFIEHRDRRKRAMLVDADSYEYLVSRVHALTEMTEPGFRLLGSMQTHLSAEELTADIDAAREEQARLAAAKFADL